MTDFETLFWDAAKPHERAHVALKEFSRTGSAALEQVSLVETASFGILLKSAADTHGANRFRLSAPSKQSGDDYPSQADALLSQDNIVISAIGLERDDIASIDDVYKGFASKSTLVMVERGGFTAPEINNNADECSLFIHEDWVNSRLTALNTAIDHGANIICFGENDFTPTTDQREIEEHCRIVQAKIDAQDRPIFLIAGTAHDRVSSTGACYNQARIFVNRHIKTLSTLKLEQEPILHKKLNSAERTGEFISVPERPRVTYYDTNIGKIALLICVDAYNPTVLMSLLRNRAARGNEQIDYVLVPSYNKSPKLYYSCQVLSLLSGSVVILVDACSESKSGEKPAKTAIFIHGRLFSDLLDSFGDDVGEYISEPPHTPIRTCRVSLDYLNELRAQDHESTPFLNQVSANFSSVVGNEPE